MKDSVITSFFNSKKNNQNQNQNREEEENKSNSNKSKKNKNESNLNTTYSWNEDKKKIDEIIIKKTNKIKSDNTFLDFEHERRKKREKNNKPIVSPSWPTEEFIHQRFLINQDNDNLNENQKLKLLKNKGKKSKKKTFYLDLEQDERCIQNMLDSTKNETKPNITLPTLKRIDLQPPINLLPDTNEDPIYQHALFQRLIKLLSCPEGSGMKFDHPTLRRQHHRSVDSLIHLWTTKYAPKKACEMLGEENIRSAQTLKSWLLEIALRETHHSNHDEMNVSSDPIDLQKKAKKLKTKRMKSKKISNQDKPKRVIIRSVDAPKKKTRRLLNSDSDSDDIRNFIVSDDEDEDTIYAKDILFSESESSSTSYSSNKKNDKESKSISIDSNSYGNVEEESLKYKFEKLTNLILLRGPNGTGKSCAVQAVAEELGWEVFEVNPGVVRNRKELDRLIGDVSKNHVLSCSSTGRKTSNLTESNSKQSNHSNLNQNFPDKESNFEKINTFNSMMKRNQVNKKEMKRKVEVLEEEIKSEENKEKKLTKQSLILLEEVDIVYGQDKDFWIGVIELVSKSMRPIVMTCNETRNLPIESLPIQMIIEFKSVQIEIIIKFLQLISLIEGHLIESNDLKKWCLDEIEKHQIPIELELNGNQKYHFNLNSNEEEEDNYDLRKFLNQLQFNCQWAIGSQFMGIDWLDLDKDKDQKMLFSQNSLLLDHDQNLSNGNSNLSYTLDNNDLNLDPLIILSHAFETLSFADSFIDNKFENQLQQFESEIAYSKNDLNVIFHNNFEIHFFQNCYKTLHFDFGFENFILLDLNLNFLNFFQVSKLIKLRTKNLIWMNKIIDLVRTNHNLNFDLSKLDFISFLKLIFEYESIKRNSQEDSQNNHNQFIRKSSRLTNHLKIQHSFILNLSQLEVFQFNNFIKTFDLV